jgi:hypothetical protein
MQGRGTPAKRLPVCILLSLLQQHIVHASRTEMDLVEIERGGMYIRLLVAAELAALQRAGCSPCMHGFPWDNKLAR